MIVIGADTHKRNHTLVAIDGQTGVVRGQVTLAHAAEALLVAASAAALGCAAGLAATIGPARHLLSLLNEPLPPSALIWPALGSWLVSVVIAVGGAAWPAWRAGHRPVIRLLRGGDMTRGSRRLSGLGALRPGGLSVLGARLVAARRARLTSTVVTLGLSAAFVLLLLALASALTALQADPGEIGTRYQLTASLPPSASPEVRRIPGVQAVAPRYAVQAVDSYALGETVNVIAYPHDHAQFEAPPLAAGHRLHGAGEAEVGEGLAQALGLDPGGTLALELPSGRELRLRVAGIDNSLDHDGRIAYVPAAALLATDPSASSVLAVRLTRRPTRRAWSGPCVRWAPGRRPRVGRRRGAHRWSPCCGRSCGRWRSSTGSSASTR